MDRIARRRHGRGFPAGLLQYIVGMLINRDGADPGDVATGMAAFGAVPECLVARCGLPHVDFRHFAIFRFFVLYVDVSCSVWVVRMFFCFC